ncbi:MAG: hypothetical protein IJI24_03600 [Lachnospiraceae bacterium]|nr:hypothetical protein [Lachnospiraceae bacterium]
MRTLKFIDMTLREGSVIRGKELSFKEKLEIARSLDRLRADTIELAPIAGGRTDQLANRTIASSVATRISAAVDLSVGNIEETWESVKNARKPKLNLLVPMSTVQMEYTCHLKAPKMLQEIAKQIGQCRFYSEFVEFSAVDATRAEEDFLYQAINTAIDAGANKICLCDTAGVMLPDEFGAFVERVIAHVPALQGEVELYVQISDAMNMAVACAAAAIAKGAIGVKCTAVTNGYPTLEEMVKFVQVKGADMDIATGMRTTEISRTVRSLEKILIPEEDAGSMLGNVGLADVANVTLDESDEIGEVIKVVRQMGYDLSDEDNARVYEAFRRVALKKHFVGTKELDAIVASTAMQVPSTYRIKSYVINSGNVITATANLLLEKNGEEHRGVGIGDGPIDAAFQAIEQVLGHHYELDDFQIQTVTEGRDAMGSALVKLRAGGRVYSGTGISTDIIGASIRAYISALNKIVYEEA